MNSVKAKKIATLAILCAMGLIMFMLENLLPPLPLGAKMGLANIFSLLALVLLGPVEAVIVVVVRTVMGSFFTNPAAIIYSLSGGLVSIIASIILFKALHPKISLLSISISAAVVHNIAQSAVYCLVSNTYNMVFLLPYLALLGILAGVIVGCAVQLVIKLVPTSVFAKVYDIN